MLNVPLRSRIAVSVFLIVVIGAGTLLSWHAIRFAAAEELADTDDLARASWALRLDPQNPLVHNRLGFLEQWEAAGTAAALPHLRRATELNPHVPAYWVDLANGCELAGQFECAGPAYEKAVTLAPSRPDFAWDLANYYLRIGDNQDALSRFAQYLRSVPSARERTFSLLAHGIHDSALVWEKVVHVSGDPQTELAYLNFLRRQDAQAKTGPFWSEVMAEGKPFPGSAAMPYLDRLLEIQAYGEAERVWSGLQAHGIIRATQPNGDLVFNGNFDQQPINGGFDWHLGGHAFLYMEVAQPASCRETHCLYINFTVPQNSEYEPVYQLVPVEPHQLYSLSAFVRSQDITSDSGPRLRVVDPQCLTCLDAMTPSVIETRPWHKVELLFTTGAQTQVIKLSVFRPRSRIFPMEISGEFWLDSVSLKLAGGGRTPEP